MKLPFLSGALLAVALLCTGCRPNGSVSMGNHDNSPYVVFRKGNIDSPEIDYLVLGAYGPVKDPETGKSATPLNSHTSGGSIEGNGYVEINGRSVTFSKQGEYEVTIANEPFDLEKGRFFEIVDRDEPQLKVLQKKLADPVAREILKADRSSSQPPDHR